MLEDEKKTDNGQEPVIEEPTEPKEPKQKKNEEVVPEWAKKLQNQVNSLEEKILHKPSQTKEEVVLIPEPKPETQEPQEPVNQEPINQEPPQKSRKEKAKDLWNWFK